MERFLQDTDIAPVTVVNPNRDCSLVLVCEHAGNAVPSRLQKLGMSDDDLSNHISWDIGIAPVAQAVASALNAPLIMQNYSRLVIDCNRPPHAPTAIPKISDGILIHGNQGLSDMDKQSRIDAIFTPFDTALQNIFNTKRVKCTISIHSYTRQLSGDVRRPWDVGLIARQDMELCQYLQHYYNTADAGLHTALNQPYQIEDDGDWFIIQYAEKHHIPHCLLEICNDNLSDDMGIQHHAHILSSALKSFINNT